MSVTVAAYVATALQRPWAVFNVIEAGQVTTGFCRSVIVIVNWQVVVFPAASVARNTFVVTPTGKVDPLGRPEIMATVVPGQLSVAAGVAKVTTRPHKPVFALTVMLAGQFITGACRSRTVTVKVQVAIRPEGSVAVAVTVVVPMAKVEPDAGE